MTMTYQKTLQQPLELTDLDRNSCSPLEQANLELALGRERERIATYLHDEVLQSFAICLLDSQICERHLLANRQGLLLEEFAKLQGALTDTVGRIRCLIETLR